MKDSSRDRCFFDSLHLQFFSLRKKNCGESFFGGMPPLPPLILLRRRLIYSNFQNQGEAVFRLHSIIIKFSSGSFFAKLQNDLTATS